MDWFFDALLQQTNMGSPFSQSAELFFLFFTRRPPKSEEEDNLPAAAEKPKGDSRTHWA